MSSLIVVIINKDESTVISSHTPAIIDQTTQLPIISNTPSKLHAITELGHQS